MTDDADVVVVVPWGGDRLDLLMTQVERLVEQEFSESLEIRVALNVDVSPERCSQITSRSTPDRRVVTIDASATPGPSAARNRGASPVPAILLFCDADDEVAPAWAAAMTEAIRTGSDIVGGVLDYEPLNDVPFALSRAQSLPVAFKHLPFTPSASLGIRGPLFAQLDGFDEALSSGEDIDLCWRAQGLGAEIAFVPNARVSYRLRQSAAALFDQGRRYGRSDVDLYTRHRARGLRRSLGDTAGELTRVLVLVAFAFRGRSQRLKLAAKLGTVVGHVEGSISARTFFL